MSTNVSGINAAYTTTPAESAARATFARILATPVTPAERAAVSGLSVGEIDQAITDTRESIAIDALRLADVYGLDQAAADTLVAGFLAELNIRLDAVAANVLIGGAR